MDWHLNRIASVLSCLKEQCTSLITFCAFILSISSVVVEDGIDVTYDRVYVWGDVIGRPVVIASRGNCGESHDPIEIEYGK